MSTALVTGGARGLGEAIVRRLVADGAHVIVADLREDRATALLAELGDLVSFQQLDVTDENAWDAAVAAHGTVDVLVNNAGRGGPTPIRETSLDAFRKIVDVNQTGVFLGMRACVPAMLAQARGAIVNIASIEGLRGMAGFAAYCASKHAVIGMTRAVALELAGHGVRVNAVCPGAIDTPGLARLGGNDAIAEVTGAIPQGRLADAAEVAALVSFLVSDEASYCTGGDYVVDGGFTA